jgi:hypothetical protein
MWLQNQIISVPGVAGTDITGGLKREILIHLDNAALEKYGLSLSAVTKRLQEENIDQFGGRVTVGAREFIARTVGEYRSLDEIRSVVLKSGATGSVYLRDVAKVEDGHEETRVITRSAENRASSSAVLKQADANTVEVAKAVLNGKLRSLRAPCGRCPPGYCGKPGGLFTASPQWGAPMPLSKPRSDHTCGLPFSGKLAAGSDHDAGPAHYPDYQLFPDEAGRFFAHNIFFTGRPGRRSRRLCLDKRHRCGGKHHRLRHEGEAGSAEGSGYFRRGAGRSGHHCGNTGHFWPFFCPFAGARIDQPSIPELILVIAGIVWSACFWL